QEGRGANPGRSQAQLVRGEWSERRPDRDVTMAKMMYMPRMKRLQICIDRALDDALAAEAARLGTSKAALIREYVARHVRPLEWENDPIHGLVGIDGRGGLYPGETIDDVVYGR